MIEGKENVPLLRGGRRWAYSLSSNGSRLGRPPLGSWLSACAESLMRGMTLAAIVLRGGRLFPADALRGGEQGRQIAPQLIGDRHRGALVRSHALDGHGKA